MSEPQGVPDHEGPLESKVRTGDDQEGVMAPGERPIAVNDFGTTAAEERAGEPLDGRLRREIPDPALASDLTEDGNVDGIIERAPYEPAGRLVEDDEGAHEDTTKEAVAHDVGGDHSGFSAEEAAMHIVDEP